MLALAVGEQEGAWRHHSGTCTSTETPGRDQCGRQVLAGGEPSVAWLACLAASAGKGW